MSYCRWSSDNFKSDVYVYADVRGGWTTHVAAYRRVGALPEPPDIRMIEAEPEEWRRRHREWLDAVGAAPSEPIGLPFDGQSFNDETPGGCASRLRKLREVGYHVPDVAIKVLEDEQKEMGDEDD